jgi:hypothetical protein
MELIERYLQAVKFALPKKQQEDIVGELRDSILSQVEEKEAVLGRRLNQQEQAQILEKLGNPLLLASRYGGQKAMIGAPIFPIYKKVLSAALGLALLVHVGMSVALAAAGKPFVESLAMLFHFPGVALRVFGWVTIIFVALDIFGAKICPGESWDPVKLPALVKEIPRKSVFELITKLVFQTIFGIWWLAGLHYQYLVLGPGAAIIRFAPIWQRIYSIFVALVVFEIVSTVASLFRPPWAQAENAARVVKKTLGLLVLCLLANAPILFVAADPNQVQMQSVVNSINLGLHIGLVVAIILTIINLVRDAIRFMRERIGHGHQAVVGP